MADIYNTNKIIVPQDLPEILTPINNRQNIVIEKKLYGASGFRDKLDTRFSEINNPDPTR